MSGVFMVMDRTEAGKAKVIAGRMAADMRLFPWQETKVLESGNPDLLLGCLVEAGSGLEAGRQYYQDDSVTCVIDGYLLGADGIDHAEQHLSNGHYAEVAARAYRSRGRRFCESLEGPFTVLLHDGSTGAVLAGHGRIAHSTLYHTLLPERAVLATRLGPVAAGLESTPAMDPEAVSHLLTFGQVFGTETLFQGIRTLMPSSFLELNTADGAVSYHRYWDFGSLLPHLEDVPFQQHVDEVCDALLAANRKMMRRPSRYVSGLSGGMDSRLTTALALRLDPRLKAWTFGLEGSSDLEVASLVTDALGIEHLKFTIDPDLIPRYADDYATTVDGCLTIDFAFSLERAGSLRGEADIVLNGLAGDAILGDSMIGPRWALYPAWCKSLVRGNTSGAHPCLEKNRTVPRMSNYLSRKFGARSILADHLAFRSPPLMDMIAEQLPEPDRGMPLSLSGEQWIFDNRVARWTMLGILSDRNFFSDGSLFYDYAVFERCMRTPYGFKRGNKLYRAVFERMLPEMARITNGNTGKPINYPHYRLNLIKIRDFLTKRLGQVTTGADVSNWSRTRTAGFLKDLLGSAAARGSGHWDGRAVESILDRHLAGEIDAGGILGLAASVELFRKRWGG